MGSDQKRAFGAIILSGLILFAWQAYFAPKQQVVSPTPVVVEKVVEGRIPSPSRSAGCAS